LPDISKAVINAKAQTDGDSKGPHRIPSARCKKLCQIQMELTPERPGLKAQSKETAEVKLVIGFILLPNKADQQRAIAGV